MARLVTFEKRRLLMGAAMAAAILAPSVAMAQDADTGDSVGIAEIVVTAEKRETTAQKTPIAMSVLDASALERNGVSNLLDLTSLAPSLNFAQNSVNTIITIRGVSSRDTTEIGDPAVSISQDGFYYQRPFGFNDTIYDLERVEVLRGPQGTLYGRNATGGAINVITAKPTKEFSGKASIGYGNYNAITAEGAVNVPLSDTIQARASFMMNKRDGYRKNNYNGRDGDDADSVSGRLQVKFTPTERLSLLLSGQVTSIGGVGPTFYGVPFNGPVNNNVRPPLDRNGSVLGLPRQSLDGTNKSIQLTADYDFDFATLTYLGGYRNQKYRQVRDLDGIAKSDAYFLPSEDARDWQHEVRLTSNADGPFKWQAGAFYFREKNSTETFFSTFTSPIAPGQALARFAFIYPSVIARSKAAFGQASYEIIPGLQLEAGVRYSKDYKARRGYANTTNTAYTGIGNVPTDVSTSSSKWTTHFAANYQINPRILVYIKRDTGYKAGGFSDVQNIGNVPYGPENITSYEIGTKTRLLDNRLQLNISAYNYDYKDQQISQFNNGFTAIFNAGKSKIRGVEVETVFQPISGLRFDSSVAYMDAEFKDFLVGTVQYAGNTPPSSPKWQLGAGLEYDIMVGDGKVTPRIQTHYETESYLAFTNFGRERQGDFSRTDMMLTYTAPDNQWSLQGWIRNIENRKVITAAAASGLFGAYTYQLTPPRTYGARLSYNF
ncbi:MULTISPECIES: TonB-dependent receptor [unclassified Sphingomonas]|uniref:TonB-dependent receptor n=1 Tax=unclassified Sphingomonas TaxID=196159 RepID=UPI0006F35DFE|nr:MULTISPECIES: TonB-dependent receptor [unclassified Sphingomonas]KQX25014.1 TonB-dependent receptor [Sphingomonas sp. Root1294]KQY66031.1 TonB-dependent receptor [Sphingomonas sp. Root50]KRB89804.1 TonB-dependent receptor [Sphingomonas sp. Root720]